MTVEITTTETVKCPYCDCENETNPRAGLFISDGLFNVSLAKPRLAASAIMQMAKDTPNTTIEITNNFFIF